MINIIKIDIFPFCHHTESCLVWIMNLSDSCWYQNCNGTRMCIWKLAHQLSFDLQIEFDLRLHNCKIYTPAKSSKIFQRWPCTIISSLLLIIPRPLVILNHLRCHRNSNGSGQYYDMTCFEGTLHRKKIWLFGCCIPLQSSIWQMIDS